MMEEEARQKLKTAKLQAKKDLLKYWTNYVPPTTNSKAIHDQNFTGKASEFFKWWKLDEKPAPYAHEAREFLRTRLISRQVNISMEYSRKVSMNDGPVPVPGLADSRVMDFGSVFLVSPSKVEADESTPAYLHQATKHQVETFFEWWFLVAFGTCHRTGILRNVQTIMMPS
ncbi:hypothetical protein IFM89_033933 [Coptis chinensis]|uniref:Uncharacterized protein n=1 Tax=Coptis chinensis TaxID=261450 RepID=A0A835LTU5_9MAGN|nr:hypothetical protein IFM89_033933 [Coptis chinensis]